MKETILEEDFNSVTQNNNFGPLLNTGVDAVRKRKVFKDNIMDIENTEDVSTSSMKTDNSKRTPLKTTLIDYCEKTSLHGIQYIGEFKRNPVERCVWGCIIFAAIISCSILIGNVFEKWSEKPVIVTLDSKSTPVWNIPFPAITICRNKQYSKHDFTFAKAIGMIEDSVNFELSQDIKKNLETVGQTCNEANYWAITSRKFLKKYGFTDAIEMSYFMNQLNELYDKIYFNDSLSEDNCHWKNELFIENCFVRILTEFGICSTFNLLSPDEILREEAQHDEQLYNKIEGENVFNGTHWDTNFGFKKSSPKETYPKRAIGAGIKNGLEITLFDLLNDMDYDVTCKGPVKGFRLVLHAPYELGDISNQFIELSYGKQVSISIKPKIMIASTKLIKYAPEVRQCYFQNERYLRYFKTYNQKNCQLECLTNYTLTKCGCVKFFMPRNISTPICGASKLGCCLTAQVDLEYSDEFDSGSNYEWKQCDCLPGCTSITYDTEINTVNYDFREFMLNFFKGLHENETKKGDFNHALGLSATRIFVYFKEDQFLTSKRSELFGTTDLIAQCGGLLGLFMGFSFISLIEIVYFFTIRLFVNWRRIE